MDTKVTVKYAKFMSLKCYHIARNVDSGNIGKFGESIFDSPNVSLPMFHKSVKLISYDPVYLMQGSFKHGCR